VRHLVDAGLVEPDKLRLTIEARREKVKELLGAGMSQRKAAEALGIGLGTVQRDLTHIGSESDPERVTTDRDERREAAIVGNEALAAASPALMRALAL
jgi:DNA invertase Pin-like site-specific DNA recombinase